MGKRDKCSLPPASFVCQFQALLPVSTDVLPARGCLFPSTRICALSSPASTPVEPSAPRMRLTLSVAAKALLSGSPAATAVHPPLQLQPRGLSGSQRGHCGLWRFSAPSSCSPSLSQPPWALPGPSPPPLLGQAPLQQWSHFILLANIWSASPGPAPGEGGAGQESPQLLPPAVPSLVGTHTQCDKCLHMGGHRGGALAACRGVTVVTRGCFLFLITRSGRQQLCGTRAARLGCSRLPSTLVPWLMLACR